MSGTEKEFCQHCGASMMANKYVMNITLVRALAKLFGIKGLESETSFRDIMDKSQFANYTKLKYWQMIVRVDDAHWQITSTGEKFLRGEIPCAKEIEYFRDEVVSSSGSVYVFDIFKEDESKQKYRDWQRRHFD